MQRQVHSHEPSLHPLLLRPQRVFHRTERAREQDVARITPVARIATLALHADVARAADAAPVEAPAARCARVPVASSAKALAQSGNTAFFNSASPVFLQVSAEIWRVWGSALLATYDSYYLGQIASLFN